MPARAANLRAYGAKRNFAVTPEPRPKLAAGEGHTFVIQRHWARREHFDLRLEMDGTMKSWAVTRGPSNNPADKRLAVRVEDHPRAYNSFEGTIPKPQYGGGTVMIWDRGDWDSIDGNPAEGLREGKLKISFDGGRMRGAYTLVRMAPKGEKRENWLLIKERDAYANVPSNLIESDQPSIVTGRRREEIEGGAPPHVAAKADALAFIKPMLCDIAKEPPDGSQWLHEVKYDGYRLQISKDRSGVIVRTREGLDWTAKFRAIAKAAESIRAKSFILDGEAVVLDGKGVSGFGLLQEALKGGSGSIVLMAFDLLMRNGKDMRQMPLVKRKTALQKLLGDRRDAIRFAHHVVGDGPEVFKRAGEQGAEGIVSKKAASVYRSVRSQSWLKIKFDTREDVAIVGFVPSQRGRKFGALVAALGEGKNLHYAGRIGTGFSASEMDDLLPRLTALRRARPPENLQSSELAPRNTVWVDPQLRAEIAMTGLTRNRQLRHPRFLGIQNQMPKPDLVKNPLRRSGKRSALAEITHADRVIFPGAGVTKGDIAAYYGRIANLILPHLENRPVSFVRAPESIEAETFFQRHPLNGMTRGITRLSDPEGKHDDFLVIADAEGLHTSAQFGVIEFHGWGCRAPKLDNPDRVVFDLDPDESVPFEKVRSAALQLRKLLETAELQSFPLLSGGKGIHVVVPLDRTQGWDDIEIFSKGLARGLAQSDPESFVAVASKERRKRKIYIDWLRNKKTATAIVPWSLRARKTASIAVPVTWGTLGRAKSADAFTISSRGLKDGWPEFFSIKQSIAANTLEMLRRYA